MRNIYLLANDPIDFVRGVFGDLFLPLQRPVFDGIDSNVFSSVGEKATKFEEKLAECTCVHLFS